MGKKQTIETPVEGFTGLVAGVHFVDGKGSTDDEAALAYFDRQGYKVGGVVDEDAKRNYPLGDPSDKWKKAELLAYATDKKIDHRRGEDRRADLGRDPSRRHPVQGCHHPGRSGARH